MSNQYESVRKYAAKYGQEHVLRFYNELNEEQKQLLLDSVQRTDFETAIALYEKAEDIPAAAGEIRPAVAADKSRFSKKELANYCRMGLDIIKAGKYAALTMAGGQGTRLEFNGPKGIYDIGLPSHKSFFEIQLDTLKRMSEKTGRTIPWYIMTSLENNDAIAAFFEEHSWFGYPKEDIILFRQGALPLIDFDGRVLMENAYAIKEGSDGNGSIFRAMQESGAAEDMRRRGVEWFYVCNVDNVLANLADESIIGYAAAEGAKCVSKSVIKSHPHEKVGVFCYRNDRPAVVEYSEVSEEMAEMRDENGEFVYGDSHISCTLFHTDILKLEGILRMPYHTARKKIAYWGENGEKVTPESVNAYKFEAFIFDAFQFVDSFRVFRIRREEEFAPVKNKSGEDSPETARKLYLDYHKNTLGMRKMNAVIFDLDGTLLDTIGDICDSLNRALSENGCSQHYSDQECMRLVGNGVNRLIGDALGSTGNEVLRAKVLQDYRQIYAANLMNRTCPYPNLPAVLAALAQEGVKIAVVSNKPDADTVRLVQHYYPDIPFAFAAGNREGVPHKPDPAVVYAALDAMGESAEDCIFIGDSDVDMQTAQNAGMRSVGVLWGFRSKDELREAGADAFAETAEELTDWILGRK